MSVEPTWLTIDQVISLNALILADTGEPFAVIDPAKLEGAIARPRQMYAYDSDDVLVMGVALCIGICRAHAFVQGNKRTGWEAMVMFMANNGYLLDPPNDPVYADMLVAVVAHVHEEEMLVRFLEPHLHELHEG